MRKPKKNSIRPRISTEEYELIKQFREENEPKKEAGKELRKNQLEYFIMEFRPLNIDTKYLKLKIGFHISIKRNKVKQ